MKQHTFEGTWEEVAQNAAQFAGQQVRVVLLPQTKIRRQSKTGSELVAYWDREKLFGSRPDITDSVEYAEKLRHEAETRLRNQ